MNKTPSVFLRNPENMNEMTREVNPLCQWVLDGEGVATRKYDGTCVRLMEDTPAYGPNAWYARREVKKDKYGNYKNVPPRFIPVEADNNTGKMMGWEPIGQSGYHKMLLEALEEWDIDANLPMHREPGTYELMGPKINGNPEKFEKHTLIKHSNAEVVTKGSIIGRRLRGALDWDGPYNNIKRGILYLSEKYGWEGIVWHHPDGRMAKMKARDYRNES